MARTRWAGPLTLIVPRAVLMAYTGLMAPGVEARVLNILGAVRYENVWLTVGDAPLNVTERDMQAILTALADEAPPRPSGVLG